MTRLRRFGTRLAVTAGTVLVLEVLAPFGSTPAGAAPAESKNAAPPRRFPLDLQAATLAEALDAVARLNGNIWKAEGDVLGTAKRVTLKGSFTAPEALAEIARQAGVRLALTQTWQEKERGGGLPALRVPIATVVATAKPAAAPAAPGRPDAGAPSRAVFDAKEVSLADALDLLKAKFGLKWVATEEVLKAARPVTLKGEFSQDEAQAEIARQAGVELKAGEDGVVAVAAAHPAGDGPALSGTLRAGGKAALKLERPSIVQVETVSPYDSSWSISFSREGNRLVLGVRIWAGAMPAIYKPPVVLRAATEVLDAGGYVVEVPASGIQEGREDGVVGSVPLGGKARADGSDAPDAFAIRYDVRAAEVAAPVVPGRSPRGQVEAGATAALSIPRPSNLRITVPGTDPWDLLRVLRDGRRIAVSVEEGRESPRASYGAGPLEALEGIPEAGEYELVAPAAYPVHYAVEPHRSVPASGAAGGRAPRPRGAR